MSSPSGSVPALRLVAVFVAGLVVGGVLVGAGVSFDGTAGDLPDDRTPDPDSPPYGVATGTGCVPTGAANTGWVHEVASGTSRTLTANVTVAHGPGETVNATLEAIGDGGYRVRVDVVDAEHSGGGPEPDCTTGSTVDLGASLPLAYDRVAVVVDGRTVGSVANDGDTTADLRTFAWNATTSTATATDVDTDITAMGTDTPAMGTATTAVRRGP